MTALSAELDARQVAPSAIEPGLMALPCAASVKHWRGGIVLRDSAGNASKVTAATSVAIGRCKRTIDNSSGDAGDKFVEAERGVFGPYANSAAADEITASDIFAVCYVVDDQTVALTDGSSTRARAGVIWDVDDDGGVYVLLGAPPVLELTAIEAAISELQTTLTSAQAQVNIPLTSFLDADGDPLAKFADTVPGLSLVESEAIGIRFANEATPPAIIAQVALPQDLDDTAAVVVHIMASKVGATAGDVPTITVGAFFQTVGATYIADSNCGGATAAMANPATKTVQELTVSIAAGDVPPAPCVLTMTFTVEAGKLGTDDLIIHSVWLEYTRKQLTS